MISRIQLILKTKNISPSQFADQIQVQRSGVSHILSGRNNPSLDFILKILKTYPEIDADWLLFGKGQMINLPEKQVSPVVIKEEMQPKANAQPDLFAQQINEPVKTIIPEVQSKLQEPVMEEKIPEIKAEEKPVVKEIPEVMKKVEPIEKSETTEKIERIVIFYDNQTFRQYNPK